MSADPRGPLGTLFGGRYRLRGLLGVGGSAAVYEAEDLEQQTAAGPARVAVKVLHPHLCATAEARDAFLREATRAGQLRHPNIVAVRASGVHDAGGMAMAWIALDFAEGRTLAECVEADGPLPPAAAASVVRGVLAGLAEAHRAGLVHRDVSPRNVMLETVGAPGPSDGTGVAPGTARILDFGLSDLAGRTTIGADVLLSSGVGGEASGVVGNPGYISPEQARGRAVTASGDLYQAGALLYFLLTGQAPFPRATARQVLEAHISAPPPVPSALVGAARPLDLVVTRAMAKEPEDRFPDADTFGAALDAVLARLGATSVSSPGQVYPATRVLAAPRPQLRGSAQAELHRVPLERPMESRDQLAARAAKGVSRRALEPAGRNPAGTWAVAAIISVALIAVLATFAAPALSAHPLPTSLPTLSETPSATPTPTRTPTPTVLSAEVTVPTVHGKLAAAERALRAAGLTLGQVSRTDSDEPSGTVLGQSPDAGQVVSRGVAVDLQVASGANAVPPTGGLTAAAARATLESAGFAATTDRGVVDATALVLRSEPPEGTVLRLGVTVTLILAGDPTPTPSQTPSPSPTAP